MQHPDPHTPTNPVYECHDCGSRTEDAALACPDCGGRVTNISVARE